MFSLKGKNAFIAGGTAGIGLAVARSFVEAGATVIITGRRDGDSIAGDIGGSFISFDVSDDSAFERALEVAENRIGKLDILVNNAGISTDGTLEESPTSEVERTFNINVNGVLNGLRRGPRHMNDGASIINTSSVASVLATPAYGIYSATKATVTHLTSTAALELAPRQIRVNAVSPGAIMTEMTMQHEDTHPVGMFEILVPLGRIGETDDLLGIYNLLASDASRYITGQQFLVDGGLSAGFSLQMLERILG